MIKFMLILALCTGAFAQRSNFGKCPKLKIVKDFKGQEYLGKWYLFAHYFDVSEWPEKCNRQQISITEDGTYKFLRSYVNSLDNSTTYIEIRGKLIGEKGEAKFSLTYPSTPSQDNTICSILATDYKNYAVFYICKEDGVFHSNSVWLISRERFPSEDVVRTAFQVLKNNDIKENGIVRVNQDDCTD